MIEYEIRQRGSCATLEDVPKGATILEVYGWPCLGRCEACGTPIIDEHDLRTDAEGVELCRVCYENSIDAAAREEDLQRVTNEMAPAAPPQPQDFGGELRDDGGIHWTDPDLAEDYFSAKDSYDSSPGTRG